MRWKQKRRTFLRNTVTASLLAPVAHHWADLAEAQDIANRTHMVLIFLPNGKTQENVFFTREGGGYRFGPGFAPYEAFKDDAIVFEEYNFQHFINRHYDGDHGGHVAPGMCMFSGEVAHASGGRGEGGRAPSIDQIVAWDYVRRGVVPDPLRASLPIHITGSSFRTDSVFTRVPADYTLGAQYGSQLQPVSMLRQPRDGFNEMFGDLAVMSGSPTAEDLWAFGRSVLDVPAAELASIRAQLPHEGQLVVDEHLQSLRELEAGLASQEGTVSTVTPPTAPPDGMDLNPDQHEGVLSDWFRIIDAALRLDRTRVVSMQFGGVASRFQVPSLGLGFVGEQGESNSGTDHHSYTHWDAPRVDLFLNWFAERVTELLAALKGDPASGRHDMLESSAVMVGWEFGRNHNASDVPVMLFGQCGGYFQTGQALTYGNDLSMYHKHTGTLLALCHAMGVTELDRVGRDLPEYQQGPVPELRV